MSFRSVLLAALIAAFVCPSPASAQRISGSIHGPDNSHVGGAARIVDAPGNHQGDAWVDDQGNFQSHPLPNGTYYVHTVHTHEVLDEAWNNFPCINQVCLLNTTTPIVISGGDISGIHFELAPITDGGRISGHVQDDIGIPLAYVGIELRNSNGDHLNYHVTDLAGNYQFPLTANDSYFVQTHNEPYGLGREIYDDHLCLPAWDCNEPSYTTANGTPIVVAGIDKPGIDFELAVPPGGLISGQVTDFDTGIPLPDVHLLLLNHAHEHIAEAMTDEFGDYYFSGLADGNYKVAADGVPHGYAWELYGGDHCQDWSCDLPTSGTIITISGGATASGRDIVLDYTGTRLLGNITRSDTLAPVAGDFAHAGVDLFNDAGDYLGFWSTNRAGQFQITLPSDGSYYLVTSFDPHHFGLVYEAWNNIQCFGDCNPLAVGATAIPVSAGTTVEANFSLDPGWWISGSIAREGAPTNDGFANIWDASGHFIISGHNDGSGNWTAGPLPAGTYYATARGEDWGLASQLYNGMPCAQEFCDVTAGTPIVLGGSDVSGIDFNLAPPSYDWTISGSILGPGGVPVGGGARLFDPFGQAMGEFWTDHEGRFQSWPLANGVYYLATIYTVDVLDEAWENFPCVNQVCDVTAATPIIIDNGDEAGIDFLLDAITGGGHISGTVTDGSDTPLAGVYIEIRNALGEYLYDINTDQAGQYQSLLMAPDTYFVNTNIEPFGYGREIYDNHACVPAGACNDAGYIQANGTPVVVDGGDQPDIDFVLEVPEGGFLSGQLTDAGNGAPLADLHVLLMNEFNEGLAETWSDAEGNYYFSGLEDGGYKVFALDLPPGYHWELYGGHHCDFWGCDLNVAGTVVNIDPGTSTVTGLDIVLDFEGTRIFGTITRSDNGDPVSSHLAHAGVDLFDGNRNWAGFWNTDRAGNFHIPLPGTGNYFLATSIDREYFGLVPEAWDDVKCYHYCDLEHPGVAMLEVTGGTTHLANFVLDPGYTISGTILHDGSNTGGGHVNIWGDSGDYVTNAGNQGDGSWETPLLPNGTYYATGRGEQDGMITELYENQPCAQQFCDVTGGTQLVILDSDIGDIHFDLEPQSFDWIISGTILDTGGLPVDGLVRLYEPTGNPIASLWTDESGYFESAPLANGTYFALTLRTEGVIDEAWDDIICVNMLCDPTTATPIVIDGANRGDIHFVLQPITSGGYISGTVTGPDGPIPNQVLRLRNANGDLLRWMRANEAGYYRSPLLADETYYVQTHNESFGLGRELWDNVACNPSGLCNDPQHVVLNGTAIEIFHADRPAIDFHLQLPPGGLISGHISDADAGTPVQGVQLKLLNEQLWQIRTTSSDGWGNYYFSGLEDGTYKVIAIDPPEGYSWELYGGDHCQDWSCDLNLSGDPITVDGGARLYGKDIVLDFTGTRLMGSVTHENNGAPVWSGDFPFEVMLFNEAGEQIGGGPTSYTGQYQFIFDSHGNYYLATASGEDRPLLVDEAWNNVICGENCDDPLAAGATLIPVPEGTTVIADFELGPWIIFGSGFE
jgi:5-hydroxyisourate hydrolase-like protein (transthyretin family)